jgi:hypothetical protein
MLNGSKTECLNAAIRITDRPNAKQATKQAQKTTDHIDVG